MNGIAAPLYIASGRHSLFGWLHQPAGDLRTDMGVVICKPFGYEAVCAHAGLRGFADVCTSVGVTALRFDYAATGDSDGVADDCDQIAMWSDDIAAAIEALRHTAGVTRVCLLGVRLGALLASLAAAKHGGVEALIAVAPVVNGRRYLRELRTYQAGASAAAPPPPPDGELEVTGFTLSRASVASLAAIDLQNAAKLIVPSALILDRSDLPGAKRWADALLGLGADVRYRALPGFAEMVATPHAAQIPAEMLSATADWLQREHSAPRAGAVPPSMWKVPEPEMRFSAEDGSALVERALFIDEQRTLFAIITEPADAPPRDPGTTRYGAVMLNGGATSHIGPNRMYVDLARRWAARGFVVMRLDLAGLGDSATRAGRAANEVYPPEAVEDIATAIDYLRRECGVGNTTLAGLCAGAYHALRSASAGLPVSTVLMINPLTFFWKQGSTLSDVQISEVVRNPRIYAERVLAWDAWIKLLRGRVNLWRVAVVFLRRAGLALDSSVRDIARLMHIRMPNDLGRDLQSIASRGVRLVFLFARGDAGAALLKVQGGSAVKAIGDRCRIYTIDDADHVFSQGAARRQLLQLLSSELPK